MSSVMHGKCECGAVTFTIRGKISNPGACHCTMCARTSGHFWAASSVADADIEISGEALSWYQSSERVRRGFCSECGASMFYKQQGSTITEVAVGCMEQPTGLTLTHHIFVGSKSDYYDIADGLPQKDKT